MNKRNLQFELWYKENFATYQFDMAFGEYLSPQTRTALHVWQKMTEQNTTYNVDLSTQTVLKVASKALKGHMIEYYTGSWNAEMHSCSACGAGANTNDNFEHKEGCEFIEQELAKEQLLLWIANL